MKWILSLFLASQLAATAQAQLILSLEELTPSSLTFSVSGTMGGPTPDDFLFAMGISANSNWIEFDNPGSPDQGSLSASFIQGATLDSTTAVIDGFGQYIFFQFASDLSLASLGTGSLVTYTNPATTRFFPDAVDSMTLAWGFNTGDTMVPVGAVQSSAPIPEPTSAGLLALGLAALGFHRQRRR